MENVRPEGTEDQSVTYPSGESLGRNIHVRLSKCIRKYIQWYDPGFGSAREWKYDNVASTVYMIQDEDLNTNVDTYGILSLLSEWSAEYCMNAPSAFYMREYYVLKYQSHDPDTPTYMDFLSRGNADEYYGEMDYEIRSLMRRDTWNIFSRNSVTDNNVLPGTWFFNFKRKPDWMISKLKV